MPVVVEDELMEDNKGSTETQSSESYRLLSTDLRGSVYVHSFSPDATEPSSSASLIKARGTNASKGDLIVQKTASGPLRSNVWVNALARKDGSIDVVDSKNTGRVLLTLRHSGMKKGMQRWVGLAVSPDGVFACTSSGDFCYFAVEEEAGLLVLTSEEYLMQKLPEPLQQLVFEPATNPSLFAYGGEEIPLSVWDVRKAISRPPQAETSEAGEAGDKFTAALVTDERPLHNGKAKKRKRAAELRAKASELMWGEVWRAKNLPNDALSLPQRADITSIAFLGLDRWAVGTRTGILRIYNTRQQRTHVRECRVFDNPKNAIKGLVSHSEGDLVAADVTGRLFVVDWRTGNILYQYKGINGVVTSMMVLPPLIGHPDTSFLVTISADRLIHLHSLPMPPEEQAQGEGCKMTKKKGATLTSLFVKEGLSGLAWSDGVVPGGRQTNLSPGSDDEQDIDHDDEVWQSMPTIEQNQQETDEEIHESSSKRRR